MTITVIVALLIGLGLVCLINNAANKSIEMLSEPKDLLTPVDAAEAAYYQSDIRGFDQWASAKGFIHETYFRFESMNPEMPIYCSAWWSDADKTWALIYCAPNMSNIDFVTIYSPVIGITTASTKDAMTIPDRPKAYRQAFFKMTPDALYEKHRQARALVEKHEPVSLPREKGDLQWQMENALRSQAKYIMELPLWRWRGVFWYLWRRNALVNKPISEQDFL